MPYNRPRSRTGTGSFFTHMMIQPANTYEKAYRVKRRVSEQIYPTSQNFLGNARHMGKYYRRRVGGTTRRVTATVTLATV